MAKKTKKAEGIQGYCMKTKQMETLVDPVIHITNGRYIAKGETEDGHKVTSIMSKDSAEEAVDNGLATWAKEEKPAKKNKKK